MKYDENTVYYGPLTIGWRIILQCTKCWSFCALGTERKCSCGGKEFRNPITPQRLCNQEKPS